MTNIIRHKFRYYHILRPFSISFTATSYDKNLHRSIFTQCFYWAVLLVTTVLCVISIKNRIVEEFEVLTIFNMSVVFFSTLVYNVIVSIDLIKQSRKDKINKIIAEIEDLDRHLKYNDNKTGDACGVFWLIVTIVFHGILGLLVLGIFGYPEAVSLIYVYVSCDAEIGCISIFADILTARMKFYVKHLNALVGEEVPKSDEVDILLCYRKIQHILKRMTTTWQVQILTALLVNTYTTIRASFTVIADSELITPQNPKIILYNTIRFVTAARHFCVFVRYGALGQRLAAQLERMPPALSAIHDSELDEEVRLRAGCALRLADAYPNKLCVLGLCALDGLLPLRVLAAIVSTMVLAMQLGIPPNFLQ